MVGPDAASVQMAREMLELFTETHELKPHQIEYLSHDYGMLSTYTIITPLLPFSFLLSNHRDVVYYATEC